MALAMAILSIPAMAHGDYGLVGSGGILETGIFETEGSLIRFPEVQDTNIDTLVVGNDKALAFGNIWQNAPLARATNNLEIKKNQDSGECAPCLWDDDDDPLTDSIPIGCSDTCIKVNVDQIKVGNREAMAFGFAAATNNVKIVANQQ